MASNLSLANHTLLEEETTKYFAAHPRLAEQLHRAYAAYHILGKYLNLTQSRIIVRESSASTSEAASTRGIGLNATLL